ncbi:hypothetical protein CR513_25892, partial [Mucuna pruriens]
NFNNDPNQIVVTFGPSKSEDNFDLVSINHKLNVKTCRKASSTFLQLFFKSKSGTRLFIVVFRWKNKVMSKITKKKIINSFVHSQCDEVCEIFTSKTSQIQKEYIEFVRISSHKLVCLDVPTRYNITYIMFELEIEGLSLRTQVIWTILELLMKDNARAFVIFLKIS